MERYCLHNKYVPQRMGPTPEPGEARRVDRNSAFRETSSIKEEPGNIRCEGWNYGSYESDSVINRMEQGESCQRAKRNQDGRREEENDAPFLILGPVEPVPERDHSTCESVYKAAYKKYTPGIGIALEPIVYDSANAATDKPSNSYVIKFGT